MGWQLENFEKFFFSSLRWLGILNAGWLCSMRSGIFLQMKFIIFLVCPTKLPFFLGTLFHIISSLFSHFRSWDYPEHFGIYSQLDRRSKNWFFICLNVYVSLIELEKILISQLSPRKFRYFNPILHRVEAKVLKFSAHFSQHAVFIGCNIFSLLLVISWNLHLKLSYEFLTFISFNIWR